MAELTFVRKDYPTIGDGLVVRYTSYGGRFEISASRRGVMISGDILAAEFDHIAKILQVTKFAWMQHRSIKETGKPGTTEKVDYIDESDVVPSLYGDRI